MDSDPSKKQFGEASCPGIEALKVSKGEEKVDGVFLFKADVQNADAAF